MPANRRRRGAGVRSTGGASWLTTYSDMVTLLLAFFIMLWTFSTIDTDRFESILRALQGSLGVLDGGVSMAPDRGFFQGRNVEGFGLEPLHQGMDDLFHVQSTLETLAAEQGLQDGIDVTVEERGVVVRFADWVLFDLGRAELRPEAQEVLKALAAQLAEIDNPVLVEGHTDNLPIHIAYPSNWELSTARSSAVVRFFESEGLEPARFIAAGFADNRPIADNDTPEGRQRNRRVDIVIMEDRQPQLTVERPER